MLFCYVHDGTYIHEGDCPFCVAEHKQEISRGFYPRGINPDARYLFNTDEWRELRLINMGINPAGVIAAMSEIPELPRLTKAEQETARQKVIDEINARAERNKRATADEDNEVARRVASYGDVW